MKTQYQIFMEWLEDMTAGREQKLCWSWAGPSLPINPSLSLVMEQRWDTNIINDK